MKKLVFLVLLASACGDSSNNNNNPDAPPQPTPDGPVAASCFQGTPTTHDQLINACTASSITVIVKYPTLQAEIAALPKLNPDGTLPPLP